MTLASARRILTDKLRLSAEYAERATLRSDLQVIRKTVSNLRHQEKP
jgi:hypothetical protein